MLSTPPAFILSQDQTLVKSVCPVQNNSGHLLNLWIVFCNPFYCFLEIFISEDVRWKFIRNFQGWFMIQFSMFFFPVVNLWLMTCAPSGASFSCCYQQLLYLITDSSVCQQLFYLFFSGSLISFWKALLSSDSLYIIIHNFTFVNNFFSLFCSLSKPPEKCTWWREKRTTKSIAYQRKHLMVRGS